MATSDGEEEFELWWELVFGVQSVGEIDASNTAVGMDLHSKQQRRVTKKNCLPEGLDVVGTVGSPGEIRQVELNLVPALIESHGHGADEGLDTGGGLVVGGTESATHVLVIKNLHLEGEVLLQLFHKEQTTIG